MAFLVRANDWKTMRRPLIGKMGKQTDTFEIEYYSAKKKKRKKDKLQNTQKHE